MSRGSCCGRRSEGIVLLECGAGGVIVGFGVPCVRLCVYKYVFKTGGGVQADCSWVFSPLLNEVISRPLSICYRGSSGDQGVAMVRWTQKGVAWERVQGSGVRVRGSGVTASWTAYKRRPG